MISLHCEIITLLYTNKYTVFIRVFPDHGGKTQNAIFSFP